MTAAELRAIRRLVDLGQVEMKPTGAWGLTPAGREFLDDLAMLRSLDDRSRPARRRAGK